MWAYTFIHNSKNNAKADIVLNSHDSVGDKYHYITIQIPTFALFRWDGGFFFKTIIVRKKIPTPIKSWYSERVIEFLSPFGRCLLKKIADAFWRGSGDEFGRSEIRLKRQLVLCGLVAQSVGRLVCWKDLGWGGVVDWLVGRSSKSEL